MSFKSPAYIDGYYGTAKKIWTSPKRYPFSNLGDITTAEYDVTYLINPGKWTPTARGTVDPDLSAHYLVDEIPPDAPKDASIAKFTRTYCGIPGNQVSWSSRVITRPTIPNEVAGGTAYSIRNFTAKSTEIATAVRNNTGIFLSDDRIFAAFVALSGSAVAPYASAGTFTLTYKANTTGALNYTDTMATINAALNGLASVVADGLTFSGGNNSLAIGTPQGVLTLVLTVGTTTTAVTANVSGLTVSLAAGKKAFTVVQSNTTQLISLARVLSVPAHGNVNTNALLLVDSNDEGFVWPVGYWDSYDADTLQLAIAVSSDTFSGINYAADYLRNYTAGSIQVPQKTTERFYLPGVTGGITTPADIPVSSPNVSDGDIIAAVLGSTGFQPVEFAGPDPWRGTIYKTTTKEIDFDDL